MANSLPPAPVSTIIIAGRTYHGANPIYRNIAAPNMLARFVKTHRGVPFRRG